MRGTLHHAKRDRVGEGIIPADAGNTCQASSQWGTCPNHPRGCGEHLLKQKGKYKMKGSSPRMRGTQDGEMCACKRLGIIPADAGNTTRPLKYLNTSRDHPRGCGEHSRRSLTHRRVRGSSPRMRGTLGHIVEIIHQFGIIPADAGNTVRVSHPYPPAWDHPRGCGEHLNRLIWEM